MRLVLSVTLAMCLAVAARTARAQVAVDGGSDGGRETDTLQLEIERDWGALQNADCATACRALDSMRRAAERLCALEPGDRCAKAQQRVKDAGDRVRATCPACAANGKEEEANAPPTPTQPGAAQAPENVEAAPRRGGCAGCAVGEHDAGAGAVAASLAALGLALLRRRQRRR